MTKLKSLVLPKKARKLLLPVLKCSVKSLDYAEAGDNIGALLTWCSTEKTFNAVKFLLNLAQLHPHTKFKGQVYVLTKDEGGRHTPFFNNYRPQFYFRTTDVTGVIKLPEGTEMCHAWRQRCNGQLNSLLLSLLKKDFASLSVKAEDTVGSGVVTEILG